MSAPLRKDPRRATAAQQQQQRDSFLSLPANGSPDTVGTTPLGGTSRPLPHGSTPLLSAQPSSPGGGGGASEKEARGSGRGASASDPSAWAVAAGGNAPAPARAGTLRRGSGATPTSAAPCSSETYSNGNSTSGFATAISRNAGKGSWGGDAAGREASPKGPSVASARGTTTATPTALLSTSHMGNESTSHASVHAAQAPSPIEALLPSLHSKLKLSEGLNCVDFLPMFRALAIGSTRQLHVLEVVPAIAYDLKEQAVRSDEPEGEHVDAQRRDSAEADGVGFASPLPPNASSSDARGVGGTSASPFVLRSAGSFGGLVKVESVAWYPSEEEASLAFIQPGRTITIFLDALQFKADGTFVTQQWARSQRKEKTLHASMAVGAGSTDAAVVAAGGGGMLSSTPLTSASMGSTYTQASSTGGGAISFSVNGGVGGRSVAGKELFVTREQKGSLAKELIELNIDVTYMRVEKILWDPHNPYTLALSSAATYFEIWQVPVEGERVYAPHLVLRPPAHNTRATVRDLCFSPSDPNLVVVMSELASAGQVLLYDRRQVEVPRVVDCLQMGPGLACAFHPLFSDLLAVAFRKEKTKSDCRIAFLRVLGEDAAAASQEMLGRHAPPPPPPAPTAPSVIPSGTDTPSANTSIASSTLSPSRPPPLPFPLPTPSAAAGAAASSPNHTQPPQHHGPGATPPSAFDDGNSGVNNFLSDGASASAVLDYPGVALQGTLPPVDCFASVSKLRWRPPSFGALTKPHPHHHYLGFRPSLAELLKDAPDAAGIEAAAGEPQRPSHRRRESPPHSPLSPATAGVLLSQEDQHRQRRLDQLASQLWFATTATTTDLDVSVWDATCSFFPICSVGYQTKESREPNDFAWVNELTIVSVFKGGEIIVTSLLNRSSGSLLTPFPAEAAAAEHTSSSPSPPLPSDATSQPVQLPSYPRDESANVFSLHSILPTAAITSDFFGRSFAVRNTAVPLRRYYTHVLQQECRRLVQRLVWQTSQEERARGRVATWRGTLLSPSAHIIQSRILQSQQRLMGLSSGGSGCSGGGGRGEGATSDTGTASLLSQSQQQHQQQRPARGIGSRAGSGISVRPHRTAQRGGGPADSPLLTSLTSENGGGGVGGGRHEMPSSSRASTTRTTPTLPDIVPLLHTEQQHWSEREDSINAGGVPEDTAPAPNRPDVSPQWHTAEATQGIRAGSGSPSLQRPVVEAEPSIPFIARLLGFRKKRGGTRASASAVSAPSSAGGTAAELTPSQGQRQEPWAHSPRNLSSGPEVSTDGFPRSPTSPASPQQQQRGRQLLSHPVVVHTASSLPSRRQSPLTASANTSAVPPSSYEDKHAHRGSTLINSGGGVNAEQQQLTQQARTPPHHHTVTRYGPSPEEGFRVALSAAADSVSGRRRGSGLARRSSTAGSELSGALLDHAVSETNDTGSGATRVHRRSPLPATEHVRMFPLLEQSAIRPVAMLKRTFTGIGGLSGSPSTPMVLTGLMRGGRGSGEDTLAENAGNPAMQSQHQSPLVTRSSPEGSSGGDGLLAQGYPFASSLKMQPTILTSPPLQLGSPVVRLASRITISSGDVAGSATVSPSVHGDHTVPLLSATVPPGQGPGDALGASSALLVPGIRKVSSTKDVTDGSAAAPASDTTRVPMQALGGHLLPLQRQVEPVVESFVLSDAVCGWSYTERRMEAALFARYALQWDMGYELALNMKKLRHLCDDAAEKRKARRQSLPSRDPRARPHDRGGIGERGLGGNGHHPSRATARRRRHDESLYAGSARLIQDMLVEGAEAPELDDDDDILSAALHFSPRQADSLFAAMMERNAHICEVQEKATRLEQERRRQAFHDPTTAMAVATAEGKHSSTSRVRGGGGGVAALADAAPSQKAPSSFSPARDPRSQWWRAAAHAWRSHRLDIILTLTISQLEYASLIGDAQYSLVLYVLFCLWWRLRYLPDHLQMKALSGSGEAAKQDSPRGQGEDSRCRHADPLLWRNINTNPGGDDDNDDDVSVGDRDGGEVPSAELTGGRCGGGRGGADALRRPPPCPLLPERQSHQQRQRQEEEQQQRQRQQQQQQQQHPQQPPARPVFTSATGSDGGVAAHGGANKFPPPPSLTPLSPAFGGGREFAGPAHVGSGSASAQPRQRSHQQQQQRQQQRSSTPKPEGPTSPQSEDIPLALGGCTPQQWKLRALQWLETYTAELYARKLYVPLNELLLIFPEITQEPGNPVQPRAADIAYEKQMTYVFCGHCQKSELDAKVPKPASGGDAEGNLRFFQSIMGRRRHKREKRQHRLQQAAKHTHRHHAPSRTASVASSQPGAKRSSRSSSPSTPSGSLKPSTRSSSSSSASSAVHADFGNRINEFSEDDAFTSSTELTTPSLMQLRADDPAGDDGVSFDGDDFFHLPDSDAERGSKEEEGERGRRKSRTTGLTASRSPQSLPAAASGHPLGKHSASSKVSATSPSSHSTSSSSSRTCVDASSNFTSSSSSSHLARSARAPRRAASPSSQAGSASRNGGRRQRHRRRRRQGSQAATHAGTTSSAIDRSHTEQHDGHGGVEGAGMGSAVATAAPSHVIHAGADAAPSTVDFAELSPTAVAYDAAHESLPIADNAACRRCHNRLAMTCVICEEVVEGMFYWLRSCGHGGHVHHMEEWLKISHECPKCGVPIASAMQAPP